MPALTAAQFDILLGSIDNAFQKHRQFVPCRLTSEDIVDAFVKHEDLEAIERTKVLYQQRFVYTIPERILMQTVTPYFTKAFPLYIMLDKYSFLPDYATGEAVLKSCPEHEKISYEITRYAELFRDYNMMTAVLDELNELCANASQIAFLWPTIRDLTQIAAENNEKVETLKKALDKGSSAPMPRVSMGLRDACKATATTMTVLKMLGEPPVWGERGVDFTTGGYANVRQVFDPHMTALLK